VTASDNQPTADRALAWLTAGRASWGTVINGEWAEYQIEQAGAHDLAPILERHLPERAA
jgi:hypothetical protein